MQPRVQAAARQILQQRHQPVADGISAGVVWVCIGRVLRPLSTLPGGKVQELGLGACQQRPYEGALLRCHAADA